MKESLKNDLEEVCEMIGIAQGILSNPIESINDFVDSIKDLRTILCNTRCRLEDIIDWDYDED